MRSASARDSGTVGYSTAHRAMPTVSGTAYSISERFADGLGNGTKMETPLRRIPERLPVVRRFPARRPHTFMMLPRLCLLVSMVLGVAIWVFDEALGRILTGQGTGPNNGLLWALIACCVWQIIPRATVSERSIAEPTVRCPSGLRDSTWRSRCGPAGIGLDSGGQGLRQRRSGTSLISFARSCTAGHGYLSRRRGGCSGVYRARGLGSARRRPPSETHPPA